MDKRPVNLDLSTVKFPITALASITHRVSGVILLGVVLIFLWMLGASLESEEGFAFVKSLLSTHYAKFMLWAMLAALIYHFMAGMRHLIMDLGFWESLSSGVLSARIMIVLSVILILLSAGWIW